MTMTKANIIEWHNKWTPWITKECVEGLLKTYYKDMIVPESEKESQRCETEIEKPDK
jgi:hypothetical protein